MKVAKNIYILPIGLFVTVSVIIMIFQYNISQFFPVINYYDEIFSALIFIVFLMKSKKVYKNQLAILSLLAATVIVGLLGNALYSFQKLPIAIIGDIFSAVKVPIVLLAISYAMTQKEIEYTISHMCRFIKLYICIATIVAAYAYITNDGRFFASKRFGICAYKFFSQNAGIFGYIVMGMLAVLTFNPEKRKSDRVIKVMSLILIALTTKGPQLIFVALYTFFYLFRLGKLRWYHIAAAGIIAVALSGYQIQHYIKPTEARFALTVGSIKIAKDYFPIGTGFATFGSEMSKAYNYSDVYVLYGLNAIRGLNKEYTAYITDNYWPMLIGQFGIIIAFFYLVYYFNLFKKINNFPRRTKEQKQVFLALFITFMIGSLGSAYLTAVEGVIDFIYVGMFLNKNMVAQYAEV